MTTNNFSHQEVEYMCPPSLNQGWPCDLLGPIECGKSDIVPVLSLAAFILLLFLPCPAM